MSAETQAPLVLVADIGGTNTRVAMARGSKVESGTVERFRNADHAGLPSVLRAYLSGHGGPVLGGVCVAVAGPVRDGRATLTNLDWTIDNATLAEATGAPRVAILNDLQAQGHALGHLKDDALIRVVDGAEAPAGATRLVIGIGTGFNAAAVHDEGPLRLVTASESGHVTMPVRTEEDLRLARFVERIHGFAAVEDVLSGRGLAHIHDWICAEAEQPGGLDSAAILAAAGTNPQAGRAVRTFTRLFGAVAGDLALVHLPFGGVHLVGGMARAMVPWMEPHDFAGAYRDKGRFSEFMENFPVSVIEDDYAALTGCACHLAAHLG